MSSQPDRIPFNRPYMTGKELHNIAQAHARGALAGDGFYSKECHRWLEANTGSHKALLTHSCTAALEMAALLLELSPGDEIIMPSYTFVSTANAFVLRGAVPVFVDVRADTLNIDETLIEAAITPRTRAIVVVHYAGVAGAMDQIMPLAGRHGLAVVEDAAQGMMATYKGRALGSMGDLGALSFHETKNVTSGEGGALLVNKPALVRPAETYRDKGTDRSRFIRCEVDKYTWQSIGSSFPPGEMVAAFLLAQLQEAAAITRARLAAWDRYWQLFSALEQSAHLRRPVVPGDCAHNGHMFYILLAPGFDRHQVLAALGQEQIGAVFHYVPLHSSSAGKRYARAHGSFAITDDVSSRILRLPLWMGISETEQQRVAEVVARVLDRQPRA